MIILNSHYLSFKNCNDDLVRGCQSVLLNNLCFIFRESKPVENQPSTGNKTNWPSTASPGNITVPL